MYIYDSSSFAFTQSCIPQGSISGPMLFLLYTNRTTWRMQWSTPTSLASPMNSNAISLQSDLNRLEKWSASSGLVFNQDKCKCHRVTRKKNPIKHEYKINSKSLVVTEKEKDLGIWITDTLHWSYHTHDRCTKANKMLGFLRRAAMEITDAKIRRTLYLSIVRSTLGYATQVLSPQSIDLSTRTERIQRRATKFILKLPFVSAETYKDRLITL